MDYFFKYTKFNNVFLLIVLITFSMATLAIPLQAANVSPIGLSEVGFGIRMQKLIDKCWKHYDNLNVEKLLGTTLDIKSEIEISTGKKIDLDQEFNNIEHELKKRGIPLQKEDLKKLKKLFKKKDKKHQARMICMTSYLETNVSMSFSEYRQLHSAASKQLEEDQNQEELPVKLVVGITLLLAGGFLTGVGIVFPLCTYAGQTMMGLGFGFLLDQGVEIYDKKSR